jgi:DNA-binding transcriptional MocR family regulator
MSPSGTMTRVYQALKTRVMTGAFAPGERIDPARLSAELAASATPIREALHRLAGERLVESWSQEGFRQPTVTEAGLRDLYQWSEDVIRLLLRGIERRGAVAIAPPDLPAEPPSAVAGAIIDWLAGLSPNAEYQAAAAALNERVHAVRLAEDRDMPDAGADLADLVGAVLESRWRDARRAVATYHAVRLRRVPELAAHFRRQG